MSNEPVSPPTTPPLPRDDRPADGRPGLPSRREFGLAAAGLALAPRWARAVGGAEPGSPALPHRVSAAVRSAATVVEVRAAHALGPQMVRESILQEMINEGLQALTGRSTPADAWHEVLKPDDVIGIKFNSSGAEVINTTPVVGPLLVRSLLDAGWPPERIVLLEAGPPRAMPAGTMAGDVHAAGPEVDFGCGRDHFIAFLDQITALINVPFLKTHHAAQMSGCLKNLSHGLVRHPARFHANGCDPAIARIVSSPPIRSRLRLNIMDALRVVTDRGPEARSPDLADFAGLVFGRDPVACDAVGYEVLNTLRAERRLPPVLPLPGIPRQLVSAATAGLGVSDLDAIDRQKLSL